MPWTLAIRTSRLSLRDFVPSDWAQVHEYAGNSAVTRFMIWGPNSAQESANFVNRCVGEQRMNPRREFNVAIVQRADKRVVGACSLYIEIPALRQAELGYILTRDFWGLGIAPEAATGLVGFGFEQLQLHRIFATCDTENVASTRVLEKIGMRREGHLREYRQLNGVWRDHYLYAALDSEWDGPGSS
jgi:RimJ/RimL family protein N-acetyltransferase